MRYVYGASSPRNQITVTDREMAEDWRDYERKNQRANERYERDKNNVDERYEGRCGGIGSA